MRTKKNTPFTIMFKKIENLGKQIFSLAIFQQKKELLLLLIITILVFAFVFFDVLFMGKTLRGEPYAQGVLPTGPVNYNRELGEFRGHLNDPGASSWNNNPPFVIALDQLKNGFIPWWNPYNGTGTPLLASLQSGIMFPPKLAFLFFSQSPWMFDIYMILRIAVAFVFTYLFLRLLKITRPVSYVGAFAFAFSGSLISYINLEHMNIDAFIPFYLFATELFFQKRGFKTWLLLVTALAFMILGGFPEASLFAFILVGLYFVFRWFSSKDFRILRAWVLANFSALFICLPIIIPFVVHMSETWTIHDPSSHVGALYLPLTTLFALVSPLFFTAKLVNTLNINPTLLFPGWIGGSVILLSVMALLNYKKEFTVGAFFAGVGIIYLLKDFGFPLVNWVGYLPLINQAIVFKYNNPAMTFSLVVAAAFFLQFLLKNRSNWLQIFVSVFTFIFLYGLFIIKFHHAFLDFSLSSSLVGVATTLPKHLFFLGFLTSLGLFVILVTILLRKMNNQFLKTALISLILLTVVLETYLALPKYHPRRDAGYPSVAFLTQLKNASSDDYRVSGRDYVLFPDFSGAYKIYDPRILDAMYLKNFYQYVKVIDPSFYDRFINLDNNWLKHPATLKALGIKYILSTSTLEASGEITNLGKDYGLPTGFYSINNETKSVVGIHPPFDKTFKVTFPTGTSQAYFYLSMNPSVWDSSKGDGVCLQVLVETTSSENCIDPKNNSQDRIWKKILITKPEGKSQVDVRLISSGEGSVLYDWATITNVISAEEANAINKNFTLTSGFPVKQDGVDIYSYTINDPKEVAYFPQKVKFVSEGDIIKEVENNLSLIDNHVIAEGEQGNFEQTNTDDADTNVKLNGDMTIKLPSSHPRYLYISQAYHKNLQVMNAQGKNLNWDKANIGFILVDTDDTNEVIIKNSPTNTVKLALIASFIVGILLIVFVWLKRKRFV